MKVAIVMGSKSDMHVMQDAKDILKGLDIEIIVMNIDKNIIFLIMDMG